MKKLLFIFLAFGLFIACNNDKGVNRKDRSDRYQDDYRNRNDESDKNKDNSNDDRDRNNNMDDPKKDMNNNEADAPVDNDRTANSGGKWGSAEEEAFSTNCVSSAVSSGLARSRAQNYCDCMLQKIERKYPNPADAVELDENSSLMKQWAEDCIGGN